MVLLLLGPIPLAMIADPTGPIVTAAALAAALAVLVGTTVRAARACGRLFAAAVAAALHHDLAAIRQELADLRAAVESCPVHLGRDTVRH